MPGLSKESYLDRLHRSAKEVTGLYHEHVQINLEAALQLSQELSTKAGEVTATAASRALTLPIKFESMEDEVNFLALYHLLSFGSGWDSELIQRSKRDAAETVQYGLLGMHISGQRLDHHFLKAFSPFHVHNFFAIESHVDQALPELPGVTISKPGPLHPLVLALQKVMVETGEALSAEGSSTLGKFILGQLGAVGSRRTSAAALVEELASSIPGFVDSPLFEGQQVPFNRKAQALVAALQRRFSREDERFAFTDADKLASDSGPATIAALRAKGVITCSPELAAILDSGEELPPGLHERALRAAAIVATDAVMEALVCTDAFSAHELGVYLGVLVEEGQELHSFAHRHVTKCTAY